MLPPDLNETYARILRRICGNPTPTKLLVQRTLWWLITDFNHPPLTARALCEAVTIEFDQTELDPESKPDIEELIYRCSSLVRLSIDGEAIELAHFTVEEYLRGSSLKTDPKLCDFSYSSEVVSVYKARSAITYLSMTHFQRALTNVESLDVRSSQYPFYRIAAQWNGFVQASEEEYKQQLESDIFRFYSSAATSCFRTWVQQVILDTLGSGLHNNNKIVSSMTLAESSPLHIACVYGPPQLVEFLINQGFDVNQQGPIGIPLFCAMLGDSIFYRVSRGWSLERSDLVPIFTFTALDPTVTGTQILETLLRHGAHDPEQVPYRLGSISAFKIAFERGYEDLLIQYGFRIDRDTLKMMLQDVDEHQSYNRWTNQVAKITTSHVHEVDRDLLVKLHLRNGILLESNINTTLTQDVEGDHIGTIQELFHLACFDDNLSVVQHVLQKYGENIIACHNGELRETPILAAIRGQALQVFKFLIEHGADVTDVTDDGDTALHLCFGKTQEADEMLDIILTKHPEICATSHDGDAPLHRCVGKGTPDQLALLLRSGAKALQRDRKGRTALHLVAEYHEPDMLRVLRDHVSTAERMTAYESHSENGMRPIHFAALHSFPVFEVMRNDGANQMDKATDGRNVLHYATQGAIRDLSALENLTGSRVILDFLSNDRSNPAHDLVTALWDGPLENIERAFHLLLTVGIDLTQPRCDGKTPMHLLCDKISITHAHDLRTQIHEAPLIALQQLLTAGTQAMTGGNGQDPIINTLISGFSETCELCNHSMEAVVSQLSEHELTSHYYEGDTILGWAAQHKLHNICQAILRLGVDVDLPGRKFTPLEWLCMKGQNKEVFTEALKCSKRAKDYNVAGFNLLHVACQSTERREATNADFVVSKLLSEGLNINARTRDGQDATALHLAAKSKCANLTKALLLNGADPHTRDATGWSPLHFACTRRKGYQAVQLLLEYSPSFSIVSAWAMQHTYISFEMKIGPLELAAWSGGLELVKFLLEYRKEYECRPSVSALFCSCFSSSPETVQILIDVGYNVNESEQNQGLCPIHLAASLGHAEVVKLLIDRGADKTVKDLSGRTPAMHALRNGHKELAMKLLPQSPLPSFKNGTASKRANNTQSSSQQTFRSQVLHSELSKMIETSIDHEDVDVLKQLHETGLSYDAYLSCKSCTPLLYSLTRGGRTVANYLLDTGVSISGFVCDTHGPEFAGWNALHLVAIYPELVEVLDRMLEIPSSKALISEKSRKSFRQLPIHNATASGNTAGIGRLLRFGACSNSLDARLSTTLHIAAELGDLRAVEILLNAGANVNVYDIDLRTPVWYAASNGHVEILEALCQHTAADLETKNTSGITPLLAAAQAGQVSTVQFLLCKQRFPFDHDVENQGVTSLMLRCRRNIGLTFAINSDLRSDGNDIIFSALNYSTSFLRKVLKKATQQTLFTTVNSGTETTPAYLASTTGKLDVLAALLEFGALANLEGGALGTPLIAAATYGRYDIVKLLVRCGAKVSYRKDGAIFNALESAKGFPEIFQWLLVGQHAESRSLPPPSSDLGRTHSKFYKAVESSVKTVELNLDVVFAEEAERYLEARTPASHRVILCGHNTKCGPCEILDKSSEHPFFEVAEERRLGPIRIAFQPVPTPREESTAEARWREWMSGRSFDIRHADANVESRAV